MHITSEQEISIEDLCNCIVFAVDLDPDLSELQQKLIQLINHEEFLELPKASVTAIESVFKAIQKMLFEESTPLSSLIELINSMELCFDQQATEDNLFGQMLAACKWMLSYRQGMAAWANKDVEKAEISLTSFVTDDGVNIADPGLLLPSSWLANAYCALANLSTNRMNNQLTIDYYEAALKQLFIPAIERYQQNPRHLFMITPMLVFKSDIKKQLVKLCKEQAGIDKTIAKKQISDRIGSQIYIVGQCMDFLIKHCSINNATKSDNSNFKEPPSTTYATLFAQQIVSSPSVTQQVMNIEPSSQIKNPMDQVGIKRKRNQESYKLPVFDEKMMHCDLGSQSIEGLRRIKSVLSQVKSEILINNILQGQEDIAELTEKLDPFTYN